MGIPIAMETILEHEETAGEEQPKDSQISKDSQTASDYIDKQLELEADAREVLPYKFDSCSQQLGPLRQNIFACLTCSPPPASAAQVYTPAGVCYACSISCHGDHNLVELFTRRNFVCDCGTNRMPSTSPCTLRIDPTTGNRGVHSQEAGKDNLYNQNFQNHFCGCGEEYDAHQEKGTMFQCIGLSSVESGGCGEDWWHPECLMGLSRDRHKSKEKAAPVAEVTSEAAQDTTEDEHQIPPGFPAEDDFESLICYKCVEANQWIKPYAGTPGFLPPVFKHGPMPAKPLNADTRSLKRKTSNEDDSSALEPSKRLKEDEQVEAVADTAKRSAETGANAPAHKHNFLPPAPSDTFSLFLKDDFREHLCHCPKCYPDLIPHPQLVEEEDIYQPSVSDSEESNAGAGSGTRSHGTGSLLERGEAALSGVDRVRAIEGVMVYNHLKDKVKEFLKPYAESGKPVGAEDIKAYFEKLRGDEAAIKEAGSRPLANGDSDEGGDNRKEQRGY